LLRREPHVDVTEVLVGDAVVGVGGDRELEFATRELEVALLGVERGEVVVRLGKLGEVGGEPLEGLDRVVVAAELGLRDTAQEARLRLARAVARQVVELGDRLVVTLLREQRARVLHAPREAVAGGLRRFRRQAGRRRIGAGLREHRRHVRHGRERERDGSDGERGMRAAGCHSRF
jgi:hypothetical protein